MKVQFPIPTEQIDRHAHAWIDYSSDERMPEDKFEAWEFLNHAVLQSPELAWLVILAILRMDQRQRIVANLATGPVEDLLVNHGAAFIDRFEARAAADAAFAHMLGGVWRNDIDQGVWDRLTKVAGPSW